MGHSLKSISLLILLLTAACNKSSYNDQPLATINTDPFPSTYKALPSKTTVFTNATILTGSGEQLNNATLVLANGKIHSIGTNISPPEGADIIDANDKWITPGLIDTHSHLGAYPSPGTKSHKDGNEATDPNTAEVWVEHSVWPQDPGFIRALAGGVTTLQILPGSANLFGGRSVTLKNIPARTVQAMKFPSAPYGLKMACGENPKRVYGKKRSPSTRMGNVAGYRSAWIKATEYKRKWDKYWKNPNKNDVPKRDLQLDTLMGVLNGEILVHNHCYRADEMAVMVDIAKEFGYQITSFHHAVEAYKIADILAENNICSSMWADWWGFKMEAYDGIEENIPLVDKAGACAVLHSDSEIGIQRLHQEAAKTMAKGNKIGLNISYARAIQWITLNPAKALGIDKLTGSLESGKQADIVLWSSNPFSVYTKAEKVFIDGALVYDHKNKEYQPLSDFELGQTAKSQSSTLSQPSHLPTTLNMSGQQGAH